MSKNARGIKIRLADSRRIHEFNSYDHKTHKYHAHDLTHAHDPKIVAIGLIQKAAERTKNIDLETINRVVAVIDHLEFEY